jgi:glucosamine-phosphate N-acetyltransferase
MTGYIIRRLELDDYNKGFLELLEELTIVNRHMITYEKFEDTFNRTSNEIYVIVENDIIVGTGSILIEYKFIRELGKVGHIEDIVVDTEHRGNGYGKIMIEYLIESANKNKCYKIILDCSEENVGFYEKCGFLKKGVEMAKYI